MRRKMAVGLALAALFGLSTMSSHAGTADSSFFKIGGAAVNGKVRGGTFTFYLQRLEGAKVRAEQLSVLPTAQQPIIGISADRGPAQSLTSSAPFIGNSILQGCIVVKTSYGTDSGCGPLAGSSLNMDSVGQGGTINFSVFSKNYAPRQLFVNLVVAGTNAVAPDAGNKFTHTFDPAPPATAPYIIRVEAAQLVVRGITVTGAAYSEHLASLTRLRTSGGGNVNSVTLAKFYAGALGTVTTDTKELLCHGANRPDPDFAPNPPPAVPNRVDVCVPKR